MSRRTSVEVWGGGSKERVEGSFSSYLCYHSWVLRGRTRLIRRISKDNMVFMVFRILPFTVGEDTVVQMSAGASTAIFHFHLTGMGESLSCDRGEILPPKPRRLYHYFRELINKKERSFLPAIKNGGATAKI